VGEDQAILATRPAAWTKQRWVGMLAWWLLVHAGMAGIRWVVAAMSGEVGWFSSAPAGPIAGQTR
jgi:hypothetical protein